MILIYDPGLCFCGGDLFDEMKRFEMHVKPPFQPRVLRKLSETLRMFWGVLGAKPRLQIVISSLPEHSELSIPEYSECFGKFRLQTRLEGRFNMCFQPYIFISSNHSPQTNTGREHNQNHTHNIFIPTTDILIMMPHIA